MAFSFGSEASSAWRLYDLSCLLRLRVFHVVLETLFASSEDLAYSEEAIAFRSKTEN